MAVNREKTTPAADTGATPAFDNSYARLPERFYARVAPTPVAEPRLLRLNESLARQLGTDPALLTAREGVDMLAGNRVPDTAAPLAMAYAGHQFGRFVPQLGDGRAVLLGELVDSAGVRRDVQLKGAGMTPFSRQGDGRAALGPVVREYLASEAMAGLGIPTQRALAMVTTGETVQRERPEPGAVLTRVATSHVRVGTFEYFHRRGDAEAVRTLADYVIARHYPDRAESAQPYRALLDEVVARTADLIADWLLVGFIHGVMNTDNVSIVGETIDYGPFGFIDTFHPYTVFSAIDRGGRYAYNQQARIGHWNLQRFAETLLPLLADDEDRAATSAEEALEAFEPRFETRYNAGLRAKLGLVESRTGDDELGYELLEAMAEQRADYTLTFRRLADLRGEDSGADDRVRELFDDPSAFDAWVTKWRRRLASEARDDAERAAAMRAVNPAYVLRNHLAQRAIDHVAGGGQGILNELLTVLASPYEDHPGYEAYARPPTPEEVVPRVGCGT